MLVIIKSAPDMPEGKRGIKLAADMAADVCLMQNAVYFVHSDRLKNISGTIYILDEDCKLRGIHARQLDMKTKKLDYDGLVDKLITEDKVIGVF